VISWRTDFALWWPDYDHKPQACHARVMARRRDVDGAVQLCKQRRTCVQAGGHAGIWPLRLAGTFGEVLTFEPEPALFQCLKRNLELSEAHNIIASETALGDRSGLVKLRPAPSAGSWRVDEAGTYSVAQVAIDDMGLTQLDALILDVEGYEPQVIAGAARTIERCRPVIMVEELPRSRATIRTVLDELGYVHVFQVHDDHVYVRA